jgi:hypothetical protein
MQLSLLNLYHSGYSDENRVAISVIIFYRQIILVISLPRYEYSEVKWYRN